MAEGEFRRSEAASRIGVDGGEIRCLCALRPAAHERPNWRPRRRGPVSRSEPRLGATSGEAAYGSPKRLHPNQRARVPARSDPISKGPSMEPAISMRQAILRWIKVSLARKMLHLFRDRAPKRRGVGAAPELSGAPPPERGASPQGGWANAHPFQ